MAVPIALLFASTVALQAFTQQEQTSQLIDRSSVRLLDALTGASKNHLAEFLDEPFRIQRDIADAISRHALYTEGNLAPIHTHIRDVFRTLYLDRQQISVLSFGSQRGEYAGLRRERGDPPFSLMLQDASTGGRLNIYKGESPGSEIRASFAGYDPRVRPWYVPVEKTRRSAWSAIYTNLDERAEITISAMSPVLRGNALLGVMEADLSLLDLSRFLRDEPLRNKGLILITDPEGRLIAHSEKESILADGSGPTARGERIHLTESPSPLIRAAAPYLIRQPFAGGHNFKLNIAGEIFFGRTTPFADNRGIDWRIIVLVPEADLVGNVRSSSQRTMLWIIGFAALGLLLVLWVINRVTAPIHKTAEAANRLAQGEWDASVDQNGVLKETTLLMRAFNEMARRLQESFGHLRQQLTHDSLTHLFTRRGLLEAVDWTKLRPGVLCLVGLDAFRAINDTVGYTTGDHLLQAIANRLRENLPDSTLLARVGGDEFALLHPGCADEHAARAFGERVQALFAAPFSFGADEILVTASVGVIGGDVNRHSFPDWLRSASVALGEAKRRSRGQCVVFETPMMEASMDRARLANELRHAVEGNRFQVYYQPVIDLGSGRVTGCEALLRWPHPERGMISPAIFIPIAEESDLILTLGEWVLRTATHDMAQKLGDLPADFELHVNLSPRQLIQSDFIGTLQNVLRESQLPARHLTLELTESQLIEQDYVIEERLRNIRMMGIGIAIDDFGTGYSSLAYLSRLPFDCVKIDQSFVRKLANSSQDAAIVTAVLHMAKGFGVTVVAEGVETATEARLLGEMGCDHAQGYFFGRPVALDDFDWSPRPPA